MGNSNRTNALKTYYSRYLTDVRKLSQSSVKHYIDALNHISRRLKEKQLVSNDIYEIADLDILYRIRDIIFADQDFIDMNKRGNQMYSAGLNNYCRFAEGEGFLHESSFIGVMDTPIEKEDFEIVQQKIWKRSGILRTQAIAAANYKCEINRQHETFIANNTRKPYMEGHHAIPMRLQGGFDTSLDVYANIVCLCPLCHRKVHYGMKQERSYLLQNIYEERAARLEKSGIVLSRSEFLELVL